VALLFAAAGTLILTLVLAWIWRARGWGDAAEGTEAERKLQRSRVPAVGGIAIAAIWLAVFLLDRDLGASWPGEPLPGLSGEADRGAVRVAAALALGTALGIGLFDDHRRGGLSPLTKGLLQALAGALVALPCWFPGGLLAAPEPSLSALGWTGFWIAGALVALNAWNTFDNADGAASSLASLGLWRVSPLLAAAPLGFLVPNLFLRARPDPGEPPGLGDPRAYLGDGGSHLLGMALLLCPGAWPAILLPMLDLARVSVVRLRLGLAPWHGDRRHLAHRLQAAGIPPVAVAGVLCGIAAPALWLPLPWGLAATSLLFALAVALTPSSR